MRRMPKIHTPIYTPIHTPNEAKTCKNPEKITVVPGCFGLAKVLQCRRKLLLSLSLWNGNGEYLLAF